MMPIFRATRGEGEPKGPKSSLGLFPVWLLQDLEELDATFCIFDPTELGNFRSGLVEVGSSPRIGIDHVECKFAPIFRQGRMSSIFGRNSNAFAEAFNRPLNCDH